MEFKSLSELYTRIRPALVSKRSDLKRVGIDYIKEEDIWNCLKESKWIKTTNLSISEMVNDIFNLNDDVIEKYVKDKMNNMVREVNLQEDQNDEQGSSAE